MVPGGRGFLARQRPGHREPIIAIAVN